MTIWDDVRFDIRARVICYDVVAALRHPRISQAQKFNKECWKRKMKRKEPAFLTIRAILVDKTAGDCHLGYPANDNG